MQFLAYHSDFRKDFQMLLALKDGEISESCTRSHTVTTKQNNKDLNYIVPLYKSNNISEAGVVKNLHLFL